MTDKDSKRLLGYIKTALGSKYDVFENKDGWNKFENNEKIIKTMASDTLDAVKKQIEKHRPELKCSYEKYDEHKRKKITFTKTSDNHYRIWRTEEGLERIITILNTKKGVIELKNQIVTPDEGHIDFIINKNNETSFVELKQWTNENDSPVYAVIECLKNYYLCKLLKEDPKFSVMKTQYEDEHKIKNVKKLIILAPFRYYYSFWKGYGDRAEKWYAFCAYIKALNEELKLRKESAQVVVQYIEIPYGNDNNPIPASWQGVMRNFRFKSNDSKKINLDEHKDNFKPVLKELKTESWPELNNPEEFIKKCIERQKDEASL